MAAAEPLEVFTGTVVPVAGRGDLIALQVLARDDRTRPQDRSDLIALLAGAQARDIDRAWMLLGLIRDRGYHRDRDLERGFREVLAEAGR